MNEQLDAQLVKKYPKIFRDRNGDMKKTLMCWGFEQGDGWYNIIDALCLTIQNHIDWKRKQRAHALRMNRKIKKAIELNSLEPIMNIFSGEWWAKECEDIVLNKKYKEVPDKVSQVIAIQVKEKFGHLRFYIDGGDDSVSGMVRMAESMSARTCEVCGFPGTTRSGGWIKTLCNDHAKGKGSITYE